VPLFADNRKAFISLVTVGTRTPSEPMQSLIRQSGL
jgi:hypothetical protein